MKREVDTKAMALSISLEKIGKKTLKNAWFDLSVKVVRPVRKKAEVNLYRLSRAAKENNGKTIVVAGKVLAAGDAGAKIEVACLSCSGTAKRKILKAGGRVIGMKEFIESKPAADKIVIME